MILRGLKETGIRRIIVITGDHRDTAQAVIGPLDDVSELHWEMKPEDKSRIVKDLKEEGGGVAFVGDGVNDAPAMITAQVGICMPGGSNLAKEAAMVLLLEDDLKALLKARQVATHTRIVIDNCFKSAVGFNSIVLLLATLGLLPPVASALLHNMSTVSILGYAALGVVRPEGVRAFGSFRSLGPFTVYGSQFTISRFHLSHLVSCTSIHRLPTTDHGSPVTDNRQPLPPSRPRCKLPFTPPLDYVSRSTQQDDGPASKPGQAQGPVPTTRSVAYFLSFQFFITI